MEGRGNNCGSFGGKNSGEDQNATHLLVRTNLEAIAARRPQRRIDHSLYPDGPAPADLSDIGDAADYVPRVCGALDFGIVPEAEVVETLRNLREVFDQHPLLASPAYHHLRRLFGWPLTRASK